MNDMLNNLFEKWSGKAADTIDALPQSGSNRKYFRLASATHSAIGVYSTDMRENEAFFSFSKSLRDGGIKVPKLYATDTNYNIYLQEDLGDETLFSLINKERAANGGSFTPRLVDIYKKILADLVEIQYVGRERIDFSKCYPRDAFDSQSMTWDLNYFKYYFLKLAHIPFDEQYLENDFRTLIDFLLQTDCQYFLYRDFQSRNIMIVNDVPYYIDYQGGRRGALQYDVASLLYDAKADIPADVRNELLNEYVSHLKTEEQQSFLKYYYAYVLIRIMQAMGAYGYRGFFERKTHFLRSIPFAINNLREVLQQPIPIDIPELRKALMAVCNNEDLQNISKSGRLTVHVSSFSYRHGIPNDNSGNGGGFVFDCRALPNPGRYEEYKQLTGRDAEVKAFFANVKPKMDTFLDAAYRLVGQSVERYMERGFTNLSVSFGCTGGQHRSVWCADRMAEWLLKTYDVDVDLRHWEQKQLN
ncbi:MAG: phosphotransferase enzyme family protein [Bacteroidales bacterium]|jgi:aminoglycoside/choline kinase family phosphotransferase|nr:phosphotransferase enzyme family protein [Bacteroidales bacterium]